MEPLRLGVHARDSQSRGLVGDRSQAAVDLDEVGVAEVPGQD
jgi:hypothetical protein